MQQHFVIIDAVSTSSFAGWGGWNAGLIITDHPAFKFLAVAAVAA
jgi:hypothetical protein